MPTRTHHTVGPEPPATEAGLQAPAGERSPQRWAILATVCLALVMIVIDNTILNVALPTIQRELGASSSELQWTVDAYVLVFAGLLLLAGAIGDRFGRRRALVVGLVVFAIGSLAATLAGSAASLIATRSVMGIGAAFIMPATLSILIDVFQEPAERAKAIGIWSAVAGVGVILGPVVGGWLVEHATWQSVFAVNVPLVVVALWLVHAVVPESRDDRSPRLDLIGAVLSVAALGVTLYGIIEAPTHGWTSISTVLALAAGVILTIGFVWWETTTDEPMLPLGLFRNPHFAFGSASIAITFSGLFGAMFLATQYLQAVQGYDGFEAGVRTLPIGVIVLAAPLSSALAQRVGPGRIIATGMLLVAAGLVSSAGFTPDSGYFPHVAVAFLLIGAGMGMIVAPATEAVMGSVPLAQAGVGSAVNDTVREVGGAFGIAVIGSITSSAYSSRIDRAGVTGTLTAEQVAHVRDSIGGALHTAPDLDPSVRATVLDTARHAYTDAASRGFLVAAAVLAVGAIVVGWSLRRRRTYREAVDVHIDAPADTVWQHLVHVRAWPTWTTSVIDVTVDQPGPLRLGHTATLRQPKLPAMRWTVTRLDDDGPGATRSFVWETTRPGLRTIARHTVSPAGQAGADGSDVRLEIEQSGALRPLAQHLFGAISRRNLATEAAGLETVATAGGPNAEPGAAARRHRTHHDVAPVVSIRPSTDPSPSEPTAPQQPVRSR